MHESSMTALTLCPMRQATLRSEPHSEASNPAAWSRHQVGQANPVAGQFPAQKGRDLAIRQPDDGPWRLTSICWIKASCFSAGMSVSVVRMKQSDKTPSPPSTVKCWIVIGNMRGCKEELFICCLKEKYIDHFSRNCSICQEFHKTGQNRSTLSLISRPPDYSCRAAATT